MSNRPNATLQSTRQMLDELDALMAKMLELPVNDPDEAPPFPQDVVKPPILTPTLSATLTLLEPPTKAPVEIEPTPAHPAVGPPYITEAPAAFEASPAQAPTAPQPAPLTNEVIPPTVLPKFEPLLEDIPEPETPLTTAWIYLPMLGINLAFDGIIAILLGGAGDWLRGQAGRAVLGVAGIALILAAAGWVLKDWLGWN